MVIISKLPKKDVRLVGLEENRPRVVEVVIWTVILEIENRQYKMTFDKEPTEEDISYALSQGKAEEILTLENLSKRLDIMETENKELRTIVTEADARLNHWIGV